MLMVLSLIWELRFNVSRVSMLRSEAVGLEFGGGGGGGVDTSLGYACLSRHFF